MHKSFKYGKEKRVQGNSAGRIKSVMVYYVKGFDRF